MLDERGELVQREVLALGEGAEQLREPWRLGRKEGRLCHTSGKESEGT